MAKIVKNLDQDYEYYECGTVIIGAGVSGISAAINLLKNNYKDFLILEVKDRIGGRCHTIDCGNGNLELGAQLIHGQINHPIFELGLNYDLICDEDKKIIDIKEDYEENYQNEVEYLNSMDILISLEQISDEFLTQTGEKISLKIANRLYKIADNAIRSLSKLSLEEIKKPDRPVGDFLYKNYLKKAEEILGIELTGQQEDKEKFNEKIDEKMSFSEIKKLVDGIFEWRCKWENIEKGCPNIFDLSLNYFGAYKKLPGSQIVKLKKGYKQLLESLVSNHEGKFYERLKLKHCLKKILLCHKLKNSSEEFDCEDEVLKKNICSHCYYTKDENKIVLITTDMSEFNNPLDLIIICDQVLCTMSLGYLKYDLERIVESWGFLPKQKINSIKKLGFGNFCKIFLIYKQKFWNDENFNGYHLIWLDENKKKIFFEFKNWFEKICSIKTVHTSKNVLCAYLCDGEEVEDLDNELIKKDCTHLLRQFLKRDDIPYPDEIIKSEWSKDPFIRGVYSYPAYGSEPKDFEILSKPICFKERPFILFAGEATHSKHFSTVHGAYLTGLSESERILKFSHINKNEF